MDHHTLGLEIACSLMRVLYLQSLICIKDTACAHLVIFQSEGMCKNNISITIHAVISTRKHMTDERFRTFWTEPFTL